MADKGSITFTIEAEITGYQSQIKEIQDAFNKLDPGSSIAKSISRTLAATSKQVETYSRNLTQTLSSQEGIDKLKRGLQTVAYNIAEMGMALKNASWKDLAEGPAAEVRKLNQEIKEVKDNANKVKLDAFDKLFKDAPKLKEVFESLKIDPKRMGVDQIEKKFDDALKRVEKNVEAINEKIEESQNKINASQNIIEARNQMSAFLQSAPSAASIKGIAGQSSIFTKTAQQITSPQQSANFFAELNELERIVQANLGLGIREGNPDLIAKVSQTVTEKINTLREAMTKEAVESAVKDLDVALKRGTPTGWYGGKGLTGTTGDNVQVWINRLTNFKNETSKIDFNNFIQTVEKYRQMADELRKAGQEDKANIIDNLLKEITPTQSVETVREGLNNVAENISEGVKRVKAAYDEANKIINNENANQTSLNNTLASLKTEGENYTLAKTQVDPVIAELKSATQQAKNILENLQTKINEYESKVKATEKEQPFGDLGKKLYDNSAEAIAKANQQASLYSKKLTEIQQAQKGLNNLGSFIQRWFSVYAAINLVRKAFNSIKTTLKELDDVMTEIAIVTNMTQDDLWKQMSSYTDMAKQYAVSIKGVYEVSQLFYQQGLQQADVMELTEQTLKMARISGLEYATATDYMTNAIRSFKMEFDDAQRVVDVYSAIAAKSATNTAELATAMSKTASSAEAVGSSFENTTAMMAVMIEATRESSQNIGSALKSIISRYGEMTSDPSKLLDSEGEEMSLNKVDKALQTVGISIHDAAKQFRDFDDVITELAGKWETIDTNTQRYIATVMA